jgi:hypothetical protein
MLKVLEAMMGFDVGPTMSMNGGYGFSIRNTHRGPITSVVFATENEAKKAELAVREAIKNAVAVSDANGQQW